MLLLDMQRSSTEDKGNSQSFFLRSCRLRTLLCGLSWLSLPGGLRLHPHGSCGCAMPNNSTNGLAYRKLAEFVCVPQAQDATIWFRSAVISQAPGAGASLQANLTRCSCCPLLLLLLAVPVIISDFVHCYVHGVACERS